MRRLLHIAAVVGAVLLAAGVCWAYAERDQDTSAGVTTALAVGTLLAAGSLLGAVVVERRSDGLDVPHGTTLPAPYWGPVLALVAVCDLVGGAYASPPVAILGVVLLAIALVGSGLELRRPVQALDRATVVAARRARAFAGEHAAAGSDAVQAEIVVQHLGRGLTRLVVVAADGAFGDVLVRGTERAETAAALSGLPRGDATSRELSGRIRTGGYEWRRMAGLQLGGRRAGGAR
jgi:hypothetical protein